MSSTPSTRAFAPFEWMVSLRYLRARRKEGFVSVIAGFSFFGIMLGVATLIIVMAVMNGFRQELFDKMLGLNGHVVVQSVGEFTDYDEVAVRVRGVDGVKYALPLIEGQVLVSTRLASTGALVRGLAEADIKKLKAVSDNIRFGTLDGFDDNPGLALGSRMANAMNVRIGDEVSILTPRGPSTALGTPPRVKRYPVVAIFEIGMSEFDSGILFMPLNEAQRYFSMPNSATVIEVVLDSPDDVAVLAPKINEIGGSTTKTSDWRDRNEILFEALQVERNVMFLILSLIVLVAALNIVSGLIMLVRDKGRDIAILRTMGTARGAVMRIFLLVGATIGITGTIAGFVLGILVCLNIDHIRAFISWLSGIDIFPPQIYFLTELPADMDTGETATVVIMTLVLSVLASVYPAWRASRLDPVEALRYE